MATIGIMDSGSGGLSVLKEILRLLPGDRFIYYSDNANCPYGEKTQEFIIERCRAIVRLLLDEGASAIVLACNTATAAAIATLRSDYPHVPFIGMEPAVKPAALGTHSGTIGVLATAGTLHASKYLDTRDRFTDGVRVVEHVGEGFVELVEALDLDSENTEKVVRASLQPLLDEGADTIVLGCTHYPFLREVIEKLAGKDVRVIDPAPAVARQLVKVLDENDITHSSSDCTTKGEVILKSSGQIDSARRLLEKILY